MPTTVESDADHARHTDPGGLAALVGRVAQADRDAFTCLYETVSPAVVTSLLAASLDPTEIAAIDAATFIEVWWLARHHSNGSADIPAWIIGIAARRTSEHLRRIAAPNAGDISGACTGHGMPPATYDQHNELALTALLNCRAPVSHRRSSHDELMSPRTPVA